MALEEEIEQSLQICNNLQKRNDLHNPPQSFEMSILDEVEKIIEEEKNKKENLTRDFELKAESIKVNPPRKSFMLTKILNGIGGLVFCIVLAVFISYMITKYVVYHTTIEGSSMEPHLHNEDQIMVEEVSYYFHSPERYDIIVFPFTEGVYYIKRVIGLPGETIQIREGKIYIDGEELIENFGNALMKDPGLAASEIELGKDEYFVLGDNRNASVDSRKPEVGVVRKNKILGKAWFRFYPFDKMGILRHS